MLRHHNYTFLDRLLGITADEQREIGKTAEEIFATGEQGLMTYLDSPWLNDEMLFRGNGDPSFYKRRDNFIKHMERSKAGKKLSLKERQDIVADTFARWMRSAGSENTDEYWQTIAKEAYAELLFNRNQRNMH